MDLRVIQQPFTRALTAAMLTVLTSGCHLVGDIFKAGVWVGVVIVVALVAIVASIVRIGMR